MNPINSIMALVLAFAIGFGAGFYTESKFDQAKTAQTAVAEQKADIKAVQSAHQEDQKIDGQVNSEESQTATLAKLIHNHIQAQHQPKEKPSGLSHFQLKDPQTVCPVWTLDAYTVSLLNDVRTGSNSAAGLGDAEGKAPSQVTEQQLLDSDAQIAGQYRELATRHDALVDYVEGLMKQQASK